MLADKELLCSNPDRYVAHTVYHLQSPMEILSEDLSKRQKPISTAMLRLHCIGCAPPTYWHLVPRVRT